MLDLLIQSSLLPGCLLLLFFLIYSIDICNLNHDYFNEASDINRPFLNRGSISRRWYLDMVAKHMDMVIVMHDIGSAGNTLREFEERLLRIGFVLGERMRHFSPP